MASFRRRVGSAPALADVAGAVETTRSAHPAASRRPDRSLSAPAGPRQHLLTGARLDFLLVGALVLAAAAVYAHYALRVGSFQNDEEQYLQLADYIAHHFPGALWQSGIYPRGTQRLDPIILAAPFSFLRGPQVYQVAHILQALLFASTAVPVFLLARRAALGRGASLFAATLCTVVPWAVVSTSFLSESAAYPAYAWALYAAWVTTRKPRWRNDALALVALAVAALSRSAMLALAPLLPLAIVWHEWSWELRARPRLQRARALPARLWSGHGLLVAVVALAVAILAANQLSLLPGRGLTSLTGYYGIPHLPALSVLWELDRYYLSRMVAGTGFFAAVLGVPWAVSVLARPRDGRAHALAAICTLGVVTILLSLIQGAADERYILYGTVPISLAAAGALAAWTRAPRPSVGAALGVLGSAVAIVLLIAVNTWPGLVNPYDFFAYPANVFYARVVIGHAALVHLPLVHPSPKRLVEAAILLAAIAWAATRVRPAAARAAAVVAGIGLIALCATQLWYTLRHFTLGVGEAGRTNAAQRSWVDEHVAAGSRVGRLGISLGETYDYFAIWRITAFWNTSVVDDVYTDYDDPLPAPLGGESLRLAVEPTSGLLHVYANAALTTPAKMPGYLLIPTQGLNRLDVVGEPVAQAPYLPLELIRPSQPARVDWSLEGTSGEGFIEAPSTGTPTATATIYSGAFAGRKRSCARMDLVAPPNFSGRWPYAVSGGGRHIVRGSLAAQQGARIVVPLQQHTLRTGPTATVTVRVRGRVPFVTGAIVSARIVSFAVSACGGR